MTPEEIRKAFPEIGDATIIIISNKSELPESTVLQRSVVHRIKGYLVYIVVSALGVITVYSEFQSQFSSHLSSIEVYVSDTIELASKIDLLSYISSNDKPFTYYAFDSVTKKAPHNPIPNDGFLEGVTYYPVSGVPDSLQSSLVPSGQYYS